MKKLIAILTLLLTFALLAACSPQTGDTIEEQPEAVSSPSGTDIDSQLNVVEEPQEVTVDVDSAEDPIIIAPDTPAGPVGIQPPSDALLALLSDYSEDNIQETATGLQYIIYEQGSGDLPIAGDTVTAHYTGYTADGNKFDSSRDRNSTFSFTIGQRQVIAGWDEGFALFNPGTKALLIIPPELGYGAQGAGADIPPNATLYFDVELVEVETPPPPRQPIEVDAGELTELDSGILIHDFAVGDGDEAVDGQVVSIDFAVWDATTLELYTSSEDATGPLGFKLGGEQMFPALQDGVRGMQVGGSRQIIMPAATVINAGFPPDTDVVFEVELVEVSAASPEQPMEIDDADFTELADGLRYADIVVGEGAPLSGGEFVSMHYTAWLTDTTPFDSSVDRNAPIEFPVGQAPIPGFNEALADMVRGGSRQIYVPAELIGDPGIGRPVALIFEVEILDE